MPFLIVIFSTTAVTRVASTVALDPRLPDSQLHEVAFSHGEGETGWRVRGSFQRFGSFQYCDYDGQATLNGRFNPNGSQLAIEGLVALMA